MKKRILSGIIVLSMVFNLAACSKTSDSHADNLDLRQNESTVSSENGEGESTYTISKNGYSISSSNEKATMVGAAVLEKGGNAVDAAVATSYALQVLEPYASGIGGGGAMLVYDPSSEKFDFYDYFSMAAPSGATDRNVGVPGFAAGMEAAYKDYGTLEFSDLLSYAIDYAENGYKVGKMLATRIRISGSLMTEEMPYTGLKRGDTLVQQDLAETLKKIVEQGADVIYTGEIADDIAAKSELTKEDLAAYKVEKWDPVVSEVAGYKVASAPAGFSGLTVIQMLKLMDMMNVPDPDDNPKGFIDAFTAIKMKTGSYRYKNIQDLRFAGTEIDYEEATSDEFLQNLMGSAYEPFDQEFESKDTTHLSVVDANGMAVATTNTLSEYWGSNLYVDGFYMGNNLNSFSKGVNALEAGKRPRSFIASTILVGNDGTVIAAGSPGGNVIPDVTVTVLADIILYGTDPQQAVEKDRIVVQDKETLMIEMESDNSVSFVNPKGLGYDLVRNGTKRQFGSLNIAGYSPSKGFFATSDPHRNGVGYAANEEKKEQE